MNLLEPVSSISSPGFVVVLGRFLSPNRTRRSQPLGRTTRKGPDGGQKKAVLNLNALGCVEYPKSPIYNIGFCVYSEREESKWQLGCPLENTNKDPAKCSCLFNYILSTVPSRQRSQNCGVHPRHTMTQDFKLNNKRRRHIFRNSSTRLTKTEGIPSSSLPKTAKPQWGGKFKSKADSNMNKKRQHAENIEKSTNAQITRMKKNPTTPTSIPNPKTIPTSTHLPHNPFTNSPTTPRKFQLHPHRREHQKKKKHQHSIHLRTSPYHVSVHSPSQKTSLCCTSLQIPRFFASRMNVYASYYMSRCSYQVEIDRTCKMGTGTGFLPVIKLV